MRHAAWLGLLIVIADAATARAEESEAAPAPSPAIPAIAQTVTPGLPEAPRPTPRLKLSYLRFAIGNPDGGGIPLDALHLDLYPLSLPWVRAGFEVEGGRGSATFMGDSASLDDLLLGVNAAIQIPLARRVTPFLEGRLTGGALSGHTEGPVNIEGVAVTQVAATTYLYGYGLDAGTEVYLFGRGYLSLSLGWLHTTWRGPTDATAPGANAPEVALTDIRHDALVFKAGLGI